MGTISNPRAIFGLLATGQHTKTQVANDCEIGLASMTIALTGATKAYCVSATLASTGNTLTIDTETGIATVGTAPVSQVETATVVAAGGVTSNGNLAVTVTGARITGSPVAVSVPLTTAMTTASLVAAQVRASIGQNAAIAAKYQVGGTGANVTLTEIDPQNNDATLNIAWAAALGVSALTTSTDTTAGVGGVKLTNNTGDGKDFEGISFGEIQDIFGLCIRNTGTEPFSVDIGGGDFAVSLTEGSVTTFANPAGTGELIGTLTITASSGNCAVEVTIIAR